MGTLSDKLYQLDGVTVPSEQASLATTKKPNRSVFIHSEGTEVSIVAAYVDDLIVITKSSDRMREIKESMAVKFRMKDHHYWLGIRVEHDEHESSIGLH